VPKERKANTIDQKGKRMTRVTIHLLYDHQPYDKWGGGEGRERLIQSRGGRKPQKKGGKGDEQLVGRQVTERACL